MPIKEFPLHRLSFDSKIVVIGKPGSGKSSLIKVIINQFRDRIPVCKAISGSEEANPFYSKFIPPIYVSTEFDEDELQRFIDRQKKCKLECPNPNAFLVIDDCSDDPKMLSRPVMQNLFKNGRHYSMLLLVGLQYSMDIKPTIRQCIDYVFIFREPNENSRKNLYANYAGVTGSYNNFCDLMDQVTGDFNCLVIDNRQQGMDFDKCVFYYKAPLIRDEDIQFGCDEYRQWSDARYDKNHAPVGY